MRLFEVGPFPLPPGLSREDRLDMIRRIGQEAEQAFQLRYPAIRKWSAEYDAPYLLSYCILYFLSHPEGIDLEAEGRLEFYPHYVEIMQAFALMGPRTYSPKPLAGDGVRLKAELTEVGELMLRRLLNVPTTATTPEEVERYRLRTEMMAHTAVVRNWAYHHQMRRITCALAALVAREFEGLHGVDPARFAAALFALGDLVTDRLNAHLKKIRLFVMKTTHRTMVAAYAEAFPHTVPMTPAQADELWQRAGRDIRTLRFRLLAHSDLGLGDIFSITLGDFARLYGDPTKESALQVLLDRMSYSFGDLASHPPEFFILGNPVHARPFIRVDAARYFTALHGLLPHLALSLVEGFITDDDSLRKRYTERRSAHLEAEVERIFRAGFPNARVLAGGRWWEPDSSSTSENDLLVVVDQFALVVECKSGAVTAPARRGAPERLSKTLKALVEEPSRQAHRLIKFLRAASSPVTFANDRGDSLTINPAQIKYYIPVAVTFEHLGAISSNLKKIRAAGITETPLEELAPSLSLTDLECVFDLLELEAEKVHYLARRREFERHVNYEGDELDLLAFYLDTGFNIGKDEYEGQIALMITGKSKELNPYFILQAEGRPANKPAPARTKWWRDLLRASASRTPPGWIAASYALLNLSKSDQEAFEREVLRLIGRIRAGGMPDKHNWVAFMAGPSERRFLVAGYPYATADKVLRNDMMSTIIDKDEVRDVRGAVVIGLDIKHMHYPYDVFAARLETNLFA